MGTGRSRTRKRNIAIDLTTMFLMVLVCDAGHQAPPAGQGSFRIAVDVALVVLPATVTDSQGSLVTDLSEQDFQVYENGVAQHVQLFKNEDIPVTVGLIIDHSTSMGPKLAEVIAAARAFVRSSNREDEMFVVNFNEIASLGLPATTRFTGDTGALEHAILTKVARGQTALYDAVAMGLVQLQGAGRDKKALIVVSDGGDNASRLKLDEVMKMAEESNALIYTVGVFDQDDPDKNPNVLKRLARVTGGQPFFPGQPREVAAVCERIARDIRHQYTLGYVPSNPARDGSYRSIRVLAGSKTRGKLVVHTRTGYRARQHTTALREEAAR